MSRRDFRQSKLDKLVANPNFGLGAKDRNADVMIYNDIDTLSYVELTDDDFA